MIYLGGIKRYAHFQSAWKSARWFPLYNLSCFAWGEQAFRSSLWKRSQTAKITFIVQSLSLPPFTEFSDIHKYYFGLCNISWAGTSFSSILHLWSEGGCVSLIPCPKRRVCYPELHTCTGCMPHAVPSQGFSWSCRFSSQGERLS